ncbi:MAG: SUMF1/EgtB/PvdO family nonheme iron enzyme [Thermoplasmatota archaeon]
MQACAPLADHAADKARIIEALEEARARTRLLIDPVDDVALRQPPLYILSPQVWDLGHIANFEELWLVQHVTGCTESEAGVNDRYDAAKIPRRERPDLDLLDKQGVYAYQDDVRRQALAALEAVDLQGDDPLLADGFLYWMLVLHEHQHNETLLQGLQARGPGRYRPAAVRPLPVPGRCLSIRELDDAWVTVPTGAFQMGTPQRPGVYDNEAPAHAVHVPRFEMARFPVTCGQYLRFLEDGGYEDPQWWDEAGRAWLEATLHHAPRNWQWDARGRLLRVALTGRTPILSVPDEIVTHVTHHEAKAYAAWAGCRLPREEEWEKACRWDPKTGENVGRNPWGDAPATTDQANVDQLGFQASRAGAYGAAGRSPAGIEHLIGDVWEWTATNFDGYPGFQPFPYKEYSEVFFDQAYPVLRGGSWATRPSCATGTFRNWDLGERRQIFSGIRLVRDS